MTTRAVETSPQTYARIGGILYLFIIVAALFGEVFVRGRLIDSTKLMEGLVELIGIEPTTS